MEYGSLGVIGDGQLARMLGESAIQMGLDVTIMAADARNPAAKIGLPVVYGSPSNLEDLRHFFSKVKRVVFENEFLDVSILKQAAEGTAVSFAPSLVNLALFQDKLNQKLKLRELNIPTADFDVWDGQELVKTWVHRCFQALGPCAFKWSRLGYDGKGVFISDGSEKDLSSLYKFIQKAADLGVGVYAEKKINFVRELAVVGVRSTTGEFGTYPVVVSRQLKGTCLEVEGPASAFGVAHALIERAQEIASTLALNCEYVGALAIEFFETGDGYIYVNEIAPRVHNTGHYTLDGSVTSQFENHWRAVLGMRLGSMVSKPYFYMRNILGPSGIAVMKSETAGHPNPGTASKVHWYEKEEVREGRKLGHINAWAESEGELEAKKEQIRKADQEWALSLKGLCE